MSATSIHGVCIEMCATNTYATTLRPHETTLHLPTTTTMEATHLDDISPMDIDSDERNDLRS